MSKVRKRYDAKTKFQVVIELLKGRKTQAQITTEYGVHTTQQNNRKDEFMRLGPLLCPAGKENHGYTCLTCPMGLVNEGVLDVPCHSCEPGTVPNDTQTACIISVQGGGGYGLGHTLALHQGLISLFQLLSKK